MAVSDDLVEIWVPKKHLTRIYRFIGSLEDGTGAAYEALPAPKEGDWPDDLIRRQFLESPETMQRFQKTLAEEPGREYTSHDLAEAIGVERGWNSIAGALGAYGRRVGNRYKRNTWPFEIRWDHEGHAHYSMRPDVAAIIAPL